MPHKNSVKVRDGNGQPGINTMAWKWAGSVPR